MTQKPRVLIEDWLPVAELGIESRRERAAASALPPLSFLHVWWARRPLVASGAVAVASLLPTWSESLPARLPGVAELQSEDEYKAWYLRICGILGDPIAAKREADANKAAGTRASTNPFSYRQAFRNSPSTADLALLHLVLEDTWGNIPSVLDPTAGGGSIPYEAIRYGLPTLANDLNPVAAAVLRASLTIPSCYGSDLVSKLRQWGNELVANVSTRLLPYFPAEPGQQPTNYIFARTVRCPRTDKSVPLSPNWWLRKEAGHEVAVRLITARDGRDLDDIEFEIVTGRDARAVNPDRGTVAGGDAVSPWDNLAVDGDYIKAEALAGRMGSLLYAVVVKTSDGKREFRAPTARDTRALERASEELQRRRESWEQEGVLPTEDIGSDSNYDRGHRLYGMETWASM